VSVLVTVLKGDHPGFAYERALLVMKSGVMHINEQFRTYVTNLSWRAGYYNRCVCARICVCKCVQVCVCVCQLISDPVKSHTPILSSIHTSGASLGPSASQLSVTICQTRNKPR
jgi:hypothetical protein